jgi:hypothetical protein
MPGKEVPSTFNSFMRNISRPLCHVSLALLILWPDDRIFAASGLFPKMPPANQVSVIDCLHDSQNAQMTAFALEGLVNQSRAETYVLTRSIDQEQLDNTGRPQLRSPVLNGTDPGLRTLFKKFSVRVKKMFVYDPAKDWTFYLALMASAQQNGIPVTASMQTSLTAEFGWKGETEDFRNQGSNRIEGYDWALTHLMPGCSHQVVFAVAKDKPLLDYAVASKGFTFWLDFKQADEQAEAEKIFATPGFAVGTSLMGYANDGDDANIPANKHGIGYVVSDFYANGSFWSSFPDKTYQQPLGKPVVADPAKTYVSILWSDGDNIQFDQRKTYTLWHDPARGTIPVATTLSPTLQELNTPLLDWYYAKMTPNDELIAGPCGVQFIFGRDFNSSLFPAWCDLSTRWMADAGFHSTIMYHTPYPSQIYTTYIRKCGLAGIIHNGSNPIQLRYDTGMPVVDESRGINSEQALLDSFPKQTWKGNGPEFIIRRCVVQGFEGGGPNGFAQIKRVIDRLNADHPGKYVFMLPKDFFATIRSYYHLAPTGASSN